MRAAHAVAQQSVDRFEPLFHMMTHEQVMELSPSKRQKYISEIQKLFIEIEKMQKHRSPASFSEFFESVESQDFSSMSVESAGMPSLSKKGKVVCAGRLPGSDMAMVPYRVYKSASSQEQQISSQSALSGLISAIRDIYSGNLINKKEVEDPKDFICRALLPQRDNNGCEPGFVPGLATWDKTIKEGVKADFKYFCFSENSFETLPIEKQKYFQRNVQNVIEHKKFVERVSQKIQKNLPHESQTVIEKSAASKIEKFCPTPTSAIKNFPEGADPKFCNEQTIKQAREKYYKGSTNLCIYGGNLSRYADGKFQTGNCEPRSEICFESMDCRKSPGGEKFKPAYQCPQDKVICNPLLFGIKADGKTPFCVSRGNSATSLCQDISERSEKAVHPFLMDRQGQKNMRTWPKIDGFSSVWNQFAKLFNDLCFKNKEGADFFCHECHVMKKKMFEINIQAKGYSNCGEALSFAQPAPKLLLRPSRASGVR